LVKRKIAYYLSNIQPDVNKKSQRQMAQQFHGEQNGCIDTRMGDAKVGELHKKINLSIAKCTLFLIE